MCVFGLRQVTTRVKSGKVYKFVAETELERDSWIEAIVRGSPSPSRTV
jgi:hypothetical protein